MINKYTWKEKYCQDKDKEGNSLWSEYVLYRKGEPFYCAMVVTDKKFLNCKYLIDVFLAPNLRWAGQENDLEVAKLKAMVKSEELYKEFFKESK